MNFLYCYSSFNEVFERFSFELKSRWSYVPGHSNVGYLCFTLKWAVLQPGLNWRVVPVHHLRTTNYFGTHHHRNMPEEVISREKFIFLVHVRETRSALFGKVQVPSFWNVSQSREPWAPRALGKLARSVCKTWQGLKMRGTKNELRKTEIPFIFLI